MFADTDDHFGHASVYSVELPYFVCEVQVSMKNKLTLMLSCSTFVEQQYGWHLAGLSY